MGGKIDFKVTVEYSNEKINKVVISKHICDILTKNIYKGENDNEEESCCIA